MLRIEWSCSPERLRQTTGSDSRIWGRSISVPVISLSAHMKSQLKTPQCPGLPGSAARTGCCTLFHPIRYQHGNGIQAEKWFSPLRELWFPFSESFSWTCPQFAFNFVFRHGRQIVVLLWEKAVSGCVCLSCLTSR